MVRKHLFKNSAVKSHGKYDTMQNAILNFTICLSNMPSNRNNNDVLKDLYHAETTENELIENVLDSIDFETIDNE